MAFLLGALDRPVPSPAVFVFIFLLTGAAVLTPSWAVESIPVIHALPLAVAATYWGTRRPFNPVQTIYITALTAAGCLLSKVTLAPFLVLLTLAPTAAQFGRLTVRHRQVLAFGVIALGLVALWLLRSYLNVVIGMGHFGPLSLILWRDFGVPLSVDWIFTVRELGYASIACVALAALPRSVGIPIVVGMVSGLVYPWLFLINSLGALLVSILALMYDGVTNTPRWRILAFSLVLALPAGLVAETVRAGGYLSLVWLLCIGGLAAGALSYQTGRQGDGRKLPPRWLRFSGPAIAGPVIAACGGLLLLAIANGKVAIEDRRKIGAIGVVSSSL